MSEKIKDFCKDYVSRSPVVYVLTKYENGSSTEINYENGVKTKEIITVDCSKMTRKEFENIFGKNWNEFLFFVCFGLIFFTLVLLAILDIFW